MHEFKWLPLSELKAWPEGKWFIILDRLNGLTVDVIAWNDKESTLNHVLINKTELYAQFCFFSMPSMPEREKEDVDWVTRHIASCVVQQEYAMNKTIVEWAGHHHEEKYGTLYGLEEAARQLMAAEKENDK